MKKLYSLTLLFIFTLTPQLQAQKDSTHFVFTIKTDTTGSSNDSSYLINIDTNYTYLYDIDWNNDGIFEDTAITDSIRHQYTSPGEYTIRIKGTFPAIRLGKKDFFFPYTEPDDKLKLISIDQWGSNQWADYGLGGAFYECANMKYHATDSPDLTNVISLGNMFYGASSFDGDIGNWDISSVTHLSGIFFGASSFNQDIGNWNTSSVIDMIGVFEGASSFNQDIGNWDVSKVNKMSNMFSGASSFNQNINDWDVRDVTHSSGMANMFRGASSFNQDLNNWDVSNVKNMNWMFQWATSFNGNIRNWDVSNVKQMSNMFMNATSFNQDISAWDMSSVEIMDAMFYNDTAFNQDIGNWNVSKVTDMRSMFGQATSFNQDISSWNVSNVKWISGMFQDATSFNQDISNWNLASVTRIYDMFKGAKSFNQNLGNWSLDTLDISAFSAPNFSGLFGVFDSSGMSIKNYDSTLIAWQRKMTQDSIPFGAWGLKYCAADSARSELIKKGWVFSGDTLDCTLVGISENIENESFKIYPNPTTGLFNLDIAQTNNQPIFIYDSNARLIKELQLKQGKNQIDLSEYPNGLYFIRSGNYLAKVMLMK